jgi:hypothetical protein
MGYTLSLGLEDKSTGHAMHMGKTNTKLLLEILMEENHLDDREFMGG